MSTVKQLGKGPEAVLNWITNNGVEAAAWVYPKTDGGYSTYRDGPAGLSLTPIGGGRDLFVPMRVWRFLAKRVTITPKSERSMFKVA